MRTLAIGIGLLLTLCCWTVPDAVGQRKPKEENASKADYQALENVKELEGQLMLLEPDTKFMTVKVGYAYLEPNASYRPNTKGNARYARRFNQLVRDWQRAMTIVNPVRRIQRLQELSVRMQVLQTQAPPAGPPPFRPAMAYKDVDAKGIEELVVRRLNLPVEYDDKGNVKEYTEKEKKELRGKDSKLPGYTASWDDVQVGQKVKLSLKSKKALDKAQKSKAATKSKDKADPDKENADKDTKTPAPDIKTADKDKNGEEKSKTDDAEKEPRVHVTMVLIQAEPDPAATPAKAPRKKKKQDNN